MKILHLASFNGNIGDIASHEALYVNLKNFLRCELTIDKLEIRKFYSNAQLCSFDNKFVELVNKYDLFILGGGNFFELCWDYSHTGTTFDISNDLLKKITTPIFVNSIGIDVSKGYNIENVEKFKNFLETLFNENKVFFTVRNDGSKKIVEKYFKEYSKKILVVPDNGFFIEDVPEIRNFEMNDSKRYLGVNVAIDMKNIRYKNRSFENFMDNLSAVLNKLMEKNDIDIIIFPHIQSDYQAIVALMERLNSYYVRTRVSVTSLMIGNELETFKNYKKCSAIIGMRNHSSICSVGLGIPSIAMTSYPKPEYIYKEINLNNRFLNIKEENFFAFLEEELLNLLTDEQYVSSVKEKYREVLNFLKIERDNVYTLFRDWLEN